MFSLVSPQLHVFAHFLISEEPMQVELTRWSWLEPPQSELDNSSSGTYGVKTMSMFILPIKPEDLLALVLVFML